MEGDVAVSRVTFGPPFEGIPGHVHGGIVAAAFDQLFGYLQVKRNTGSLTGELTVRYRAGFAYGFSQEWQKDAAPAAHFQYLLPWTKRKEVQAAIRSFTQQGHGGDLI